MKKQIVSIFFMVLGLLVMAGCGSHHDHDGGGGGGGGSTATTTVSGIVLAASGNAINGAQVTITSTPVTAATDQNGFFSAVVEVGTHTIVIKRDTATIYTGTFTCFENTPLDLGKISTIFAPLPDTGQTTCYDNVGGSIEECPLPGEPLAQDGSYLIDPPSYFSTSNGDGTVRDNVTGLMWQRCSAGQTNDVTCSGGTIGYNWYEASGTFHESHNPTSTDVCGSSTVGGHEDWRLPDEFELQSIVNYEKVDPAINLSYFPNTAQSDYWSLNAWVVDFALGKVISGRDPGFDVGSVRCVRGGQGTAHSFTDNEDGTVTDNVTGLIWQQGIDNTGRTWENAISYCEDLSLSTYDDWRLPNIKELRSIVDSTKERPAIDSTVFPNTLFDLKYWSSTSLWPIWYAYDSAWSVDFSLGDVSFPGKFDDIYVRCVRGGGQNLLAVIGISEVDLDGTRTNIRSLETNEGNLVADSLLWQATQLAGAFGQPTPDIALQNGGGIRNNTVIPAGNITMLDTMDIATFPNMVVIVPDITREQFKEILENAVACTQPADLCGNGRFAQVSGFSFTWTASGTAMVIDFDGTVVTPGTRIVDVVLDDGTSIVAGGVVVPGRDITIATIDFLANGGDQYPYSGAPFTDLSVTYQEALSNYIQDGLGGVISSADYPEGGEGRISNLP